MKTISYYIYFLLGFLLFSCSSQTGNDNTVATKKEASKIVIPEFNADSAYSYVGKQLSFGPRVPNTPEHKACATYLSSKLNTYTSDVYLQKAQVRAYNNDVLNITNIIASFNPGLNNRILLCAHWDSRPYADHDPDPENHRTPIDGANDGASGVGVLMEIARQMSLEPPRIGVDIIFFDAEDYGPPQDKQLMGEDDYWALGSQYWSRNPHKPGYFARYGVLLDMVGAADARFPKEGFSQYYAPDILRKVWLKAEKAGYGVYFSNENGALINDDHLYINKIAKIPTIDIIHLDPLSSNGTFFEQWHTLGDNLDVIDKNTLRAVGQTMLTLIYEE